MPTSHDSNREIVVSPAMLDAGEQAMLDYWDGSNREGDGVDHLRRQLGTAYLAMRRLETTPGAEGSK